MKIKGGRLSSRDAPLSLFERRAFSLRERDASHSLRSRETSHSLRSRETSHSLRERETSHSLRSRVLRTLFSTREGWDIDITSFVDALRVTARGRNPKRLRFTSFRSRLSNPLRGFDSFLMKQKGTRMGFLFVSRRERDSNPRSCDRLRISRPAHSTTLASLQGLHNLVKFSPFV